MSVDLRPLLRRLALPLLVWVLVASAHVTSYAAPLVGALGTAAVAATLAALVGGNARVLLANVAAAALVFAGFELYLSSRAKVLPSYDVVFGAGYYARHDVLGYAPVANTLTRSRLRRDESVLYDVTYDIDTYGHRASPSRRLDALRAALFWGCSHTFGEGLANDETLPAYFERFDAPDRRSINHGFHGYGPHHMLAALQHELERSGLRRSRPDLAVYVWIPQHVARAAGRAPWDTGPRYTIEHGALHWSPPEAGARRHAALTIARESALFATLLDLTVLRQDAGSASEDDWELMLRLVVEAARIFEGRYGRRFVVLICEDPVDPNPWASSKARDLFLREGLSVLLASELAPSIHAEPAFIAADLHPTAAFNERLAIGLLERLGRDESELTADGPAR